MVELSVPEAGHHAGMQIELLVVPDCPNERPAYERLRQALDEAGHPETPIAVHVVTEDAVGAFPAFAGSPTVVIDGADPFAERATPGAGLSCRVYRSAAGMSGAPSLEDLRHAVGGVDGGRPTN